MAVGNRLLPASRYRLGDRELQVPLASGIERQCDVLGRESQGEARGELAGERRACLCGRIWRSQRSIVDRLDEELRVEPEGLGQGDRFSHSLGQRGEPVVEDELEPRTVSSGSEPERLATDRIEDRLQ